MLRLLRQRLLDDLAEAACVRRICIFRRDREIRLRDPIVILPVDIAADARVEERLPDRRTRHRKKRIVEHVKCDRLLDVERIARRHVPCEVCVVIERLLVRDRIRLLNRDDLPRRLLSPDRGVDVLSVKCRQILPIDEGKRLRHVHIAVEINIAV